MITLVLLLQLLTWVPAELPAHGTAVAAPLEATLLTDPDAMGGVARATRSPLGVTLTLKLRHGPFPCAGKPWADATTLLFVSKDFDPKRPIGLLVHFHGHDGRAVHKIDDHQLREQVLAAGRNVILAMPQGPVDAPDSAGGKLDEPQGFLRFSSELLEILRGKKVREVLSKQALGAHQAWQRVAVSAHSGGYRVAARVLTEGGVAVDDVYLFDALYGDVPLFRTWAGQPGKRLWSWYTRGAPEKLNQILMQRLREDGAAPVSEDPEGSLNDGQFCRAQLLFVHTALPHGRVPLGHAALRDALVCSRFAKVRKPPPLPPQPKRGARILADGLQ
ncbi:MAG: hypothetical protein HY902_02390 [Deltaproteobacteria bacterium]|nr:hypothetical protein [Deltaproteobacteria bacterium]